VFYEVLDRGVFRLLLAAEKQLLTAREQQLSALQAVL
jgi:hypothetical protein